MIYIITNIIVCNDYYIYNIIYINDYDYPMNKRKYLPWNQGRSATATIKIRYSDHDFRIMEDIDGDLFVYTRPAYKEV